MVACFWDFAESLEYVKMRHRLSFKLLEERIQVTAINELLQLFSVALERLMWLWRRTRKDVDEQVTSCGAEVLKAINPQLEIIR